MTKRKTTAEKPQTLIAYKGFDSNLQCRGLQYELGKTYQHSGRVELCSSGFHSCESPFDVWGYYGVVDSRFAEVEISGELSRNGSDTKIASASITIKAELTLPQFIKRGIDYLLKLTKDVSANTEGVTASSECYAQIGSSGDYAQIGSSGDYAQIGSSGNYAQIGSSGNYAQIGSSGSGAQIGSSGHGAQIEASGDDAVVACAGSIYRFKLGPNGCIAVPYNDGKRVRFACAYVGENGIKAGVWYERQGDAFVEVQP